jgi:hypothetical protein
MTNEQMNLLVATIVNCTNAIVATISCAHGCTGAYADVTRYLNEDEDQK